ncbi:hypothetical protein [Nostoc commune]|nr:hypothetical protein [Nostoc commune]
MKTFPLFPLPFNRTVLEVDVEAEATPALEYEKWLRDRIIARIPGGGS